MKKSPLPESGSLGDADDNLVAPLILAGFRHWPKVWTAFRDGHKSWWERVGSGGPVYCLPRIIVDELASSGDVDRRTGRLRDAIIPPEDAGAEHKFTEICLSYLTNTIGVWGGIPISYHHLRDRSQEDPLRATALEQIDNEYDNLKKLGWNSILKSKKDAHELINRSLKHPLLSTNQSLGSVGKIIFDPQFRGELSGLKSSWMKLETRPPFPLIPGSLSLPDGPNNMILKENVILPGELVSFLQDLRRFMSKWDLSQLATWDLPVPHGILESLPSGLIARLRGPESPATYIPNHLDLPSNYDHKRSIRVGQRKVAEEAGIRAPRPLTGTSARGDSASEYENALRLWLIERSVLARYGRSHGLVARLSKAFSKLLDREMDRVKQLRKIYLPYVDEA